jgi:4-hydroxy-tetrahydrodipicolinate synthase
VDSALAHWRHRVIPAVPVPFNQRGAIDSQLQRDYVSWMSQQDIAAVAIWAHTGRGLHLSQDERAQVLEDWNANARSLPIVCGVGVPVGARMPSDPGARTDAVLRAATDMARDAKRGGATALLAYGPLLLRGMPDEEERLVAYHAALADVGLPVIAFFLYEAAGGWSYPRPALEAILDVDGVEAIKVATLDSIMTFQDVANIVRAVPGVLLITGEDRFLGYSVSLGATSALVGIAAAVTEHSVKLVRAWGDQDFALFHRESAALDDFAQATFVHPMEGYVQRMLWALEDDGVFPRVAQDRHGPPLSRESRDVVRQAVHHLRRSSS